jgi:antitoxin FitA
MAQLIVRNLDDTVKERLKRRAARSGRSVEAEIRDILSKAVGEKEAGEEGLGTLIARHFAGKGRGIDFEIAEWRGQKARPTRFRK